MSASSKKVSTPHLQRLQLLRGFLPRVIAGLAVMALTVLIQLAYPKALAYFIDRIQLQKELSWLSHFAALMFTVVVLQAIATTLRYYIFESTGHMIVTKIRRLLFTALMHQTIGFYDKHNVGELSNHLSADVEVLHDSLTMGLAISLRSLCVLLGSVIMLMLISPLLSLVLLVFIPLNLYLGDFLGKHIRVRAKHIQECQAACGKVAHEHFSNIRLVHAFNQQAKAFELYFKATQTRLLAAISSTRLMATFRGLASFLMYLALLITLWLGARLIVKGEMSVGELSSFVIYASMAASSSEAISDFWSEWMRTLGATERVFEMIAISPENKPGGQKKADLKGNIEFHQVSFSYPERSREKALTELSFQVQAGQKLALVGASGAGKSSIANLLLGFYEIGHGYIAFDGECATSLNIHEIRHHIAIVEQEPSLFSGSIAENIAFAVSDAVVKQEDIVHAAKLANAHEFISEFPDRYDTLVGDRGVQLSGGQKQRIAIARALLRNPRILILDEATSALDSASELLVQQALDKLMEGRTTIIIAHRFSTIMKADHIVVLEKGSIVQQGQHAELVNDQSGLYFHLMKNQMQPLRQLLSA